MAIYTGPRGRLLRSIRCKGCETPLCNFSWLLVSACACPVEKSAKQTVSDDIAAVLNASLLEGIAESTANGVKIVSEGIKTVGDIINIFKNKKIKENNDEES